MQPAGCSPIGQCLRRLASESKLSLLLTKLGAYQTLGTLQAVGRWLLPPRQCPGPLFAYNPASPSILSRVMSSYYVIRNQKERYTKHGHELKAGEGLTFTEDWRREQSRFVDDPRAAVVALSNSGPSLE